MQLETLKNILIWLERVQLSGKEAFPLVFAHQEVSEEIRRMTAPPSPPADEEKKAS